VEDGAPHAARGAGHDHADVAASDGRGHGYTSPSSASVARTFSRAGPEMG
jgi:hypothetical protein